MSRASFRVAFEGEPFNEGEIDVSDFAPALLALSDVVRSANGALNGDQASARLKLRATDEGCFEALLSIDISVVDTINGILNAVAEEQARVTAANQLLDLLLKGGAVVSSPIVGLFAILKILRGRKPDLVESRDDNTTAVTVGDTTVFVDQRTVLLLEDLPTREALEKFGDKALKIPGISTLRIGTKGAEDELVLNNNDAFVFKVPEHEDEEPLVQEENRVSWLKIVTTHFRDGYKWRFSDGGEKPFTAEVEDTEFLNDVLQGKIALSANDTLRCEICEEQKLTSSGLSKRVRVLKVLELVPGAKQLRLI